MRFFSPSIAMWWFMIVDCLMCWLTWNSYSRMTKCSHCMCEVLSHVKTLNKNSHFILSSSPCVSDFVGVILFIFALLSRYMSTCPPDIYLLLQSHMIRIHHKAFSCLFLFSNWLIFWTAAAVSAWLTGCETVNDF